jgi:hypothetical protein
MGSAVLNEWCLRVRAFVRTEFGLLITLAVSLLVAYVGLALVISGRHHLVGAAVLLFSLSSTLSAASAHNQMHRERGETAHAVWRGIRPRR